MRKRWWLAGLVWGLAAGAASAQAVTWGGRVPQTIQYKVVGGANAPVNAPMAQPDGFSLGGLWGKVSGLWKKPTPSSGWAAPTAGQPRKNSRNVPRPK
jgi:hypothetical protein